MYEISPEPRIKYGIAEPLTSRSVFGNDPVLDPNEGFPDALAHKPQYIIFSREYIITGKCGKYGRNIPTGHSSFVRFGLPGNI